MESIDNPAISRVILHKDWTKGNILHNLLSLAWPIIVAYSVYTVGSTVEMICVGKLGAAAIAGVSVAGIIIGVATYFVYFRMGRWKRKRL
jgi:Na+-driven multidrug efflux pump